MVEAVSAEQWTAVREGLRGTAAHFAALLNECDWRDQGSMATRDWSVADTAAHVTAIALLDKALVQPGPASLPYPWDVLEDQARVTTVDTLGQLNDRTLKLLTERSPGVLADQLQAHVDEALHVSAGQDPGRPVPWLGGACVPLAGIFAHLINELQIHGRDIARATGLHWAIEPERAAWFLEIFVAGIARYGAGCLLGKPGPPERRRIAVEFRSGYTAPLTLLLADGTLKLGETGSRPQVRLRFEPVTMNLMLFGRISQLRAVLSGRVLIGGPYPWLLPAFQRTVRFPS